MKNATVAKVLFVLGAGLVSGSLAYMGTALFGLSVFPCALSGVEAGIWASINVAMLLVWARSR